MGEGPRHRQEGGRGRQPRQAVAPAGELEVDRPCRERRQCHRAESVGRQRREQVASRVPAGQPQQGVESRVAVGLLAAERPAGPQRGVAEHLPAGVAAGRVDERVEPLPEGLLAANGVPLVPDDAVIAAGTDQGQEGDDRDRRGDQPVGAREAKPGLAGRAAGRRPGRSRQSCRALRPCDSSCPRDGRGLDPIHGRGAGPNSIDRGRSLHQAGDRAECICEISAPFVPSRLPGVMHTPCNPERSTTHRPGSISWPALVIFVLVSAGLVVPTLWNLTRSEARRRRRAYTRGDLAAASSPPSTTWAGALERRGGAVRGPVPEPARLLRRRRALLPPGRPARPERHAHPARTAWHTGTGASRRSRRTRRSSGATPRMSSRSAGSPRSSSRGVTPRSSSSWPIGWPGYPGGPRLRHAPRGRRGTMTRTTSRRAPPLNASWSSTRISARCPCRAACSGRSSPRTCWPAAASRRRPAISPGPWRPAPTPGCRTCSAGPISSRGSWTRPSAFREAAEAAPGDHAPYLDLGKLEIQRQRYAEALKYLDKALALSPQQIDVLYGQARAYRLLGRSADADRLDETIKQMPRPPRTGPPRRRRLAALCPLTGDCRGRCAALRPEDRSSSMRSPSAQGDMGQPGPLATDLS